MEKCKLLIKYKLLYWLSMCVLGLSMYIFGHLLVMMYYPFKTIDIKQPMKVAETDVNSGGTVTYVAEYNKYIDSDASLLTQLYNINTKHYISFPLEYSNVFPGVGVAMRQVSIPKDVCPGTYRIVSTVKYQINTLRVISKMFVSEEFRVSK